MTKPRPAAKTPSTAIARVLRDLGLKQGKDFRVRGQYEKGARRGTHVIAYTAEADAIVADRADHIEQAVFDDGGWSFCVSVHYTNSGRRWTWVANYGLRVRETAPVTPEDAAALDMVAVPTSDEFNRTQVTGRTLRQGVTPNAALPYPGSPSSITDPAQQAPAEDEWPTGTRVSFVNSKGVTVWATVSGTDTGTVTDPDHSNYGRAYVGVYEDATPSRPWKQRSRPFADKLTRVV